MNRDIENRFNQCKGPSQTDVLKVAFPRELVIGEHYAPTAGIALNATLTEGQTVTDVTYHQYRKIDNFDILLDYMKILPKKKRLFHEVIRGLVNLYFDFECARDEENWFNEQDLREFIDNIQKHCENILTECGHTDAKTFYWANASNTKKMSLHLVLKMDKFLLDMAKECKLVAVELCNRLVAQAMNDENVMKFMSHREGKLVAPIDLQVYTMHRNFRTIFSTKPNEERYMLPLKTITPTFEYYKFASGNFKILKEFFVNVLADEDALYKSGVRVYNFESLRHNDITKYISTTPDVISSGNIDEIIQRLGGVVYCSTSGPFINLKNIGERICFLSGRKHGIKSNRCYLINKNDGVYYGCFSTKCHEIAKQKTKRILSNKMLLMKQLGVNELTYNLVERVIKADMLPKHKIKALMVLLKSCLKFVSSRGVYLTKTYKNYQVTYDVVKQSTLDYSLSKMKILCNGKRISITDILNFPYKRGILLNYIITTYVDFIPYGKNKPKKIPETLNLFTGFCTKYDKELLTNSTNVLARSWLAWFWNHTKNVVCNGDEIIFQHFRKYLAWLFQYPENPTTLDIALYGGQGNGKSLIFETLGLEIFGVYHVMLSNSNKLAGNFNGFMAKKLLIILDEKQETNDSFHQIQKSLTTSRTVMIEEKFCEGVTTVNYVNLVSTVNNINNLTAEQGERRLKILYCPATDNSVPYFKKYCDLGNRMQAEDRHIFATMLYTELMDIDLTEYQCQEFPITKWTMSRIIVAISPAFSSLLDLVKKRDPRIFEHENDMCVFLDDMYEKYKSFCLSYGHKATLTRPALIETLKTSDLGINEFRKRHQKRRDQALVFTINSLQNGFRKMFKDSEYKIFDEDNTPESDDEDIPGTPSESSNSLKMMDNGKIVGEILLTTFKTEEKKEIEISDASVSEESNKRMYEIDDLDELT